MDVRLRVTRISPRSVKQSNRPPEQDCLMSCTIGGLAEGCSEKIHEEDWILGWMVSIWQGIFQASFTTAQNMVIGQLTMHILHCAFLIYNWKNCDQQHIKICPAIWIWTYFMHHFIVYSATLTRTNSLMRRSWTWVNPPLNTSMVLRHCNFLLPNFLRWLFNLLGPQ